MATDERRNFLRTVRAAKRAYWRRIIDDIKTDRDLYRIIGWHKQTPKATSALLTVGERTITDPIEKAEALRTAILDRFNADDDLTDNDVPPARNPTLLWDTNISMEEAEKNTIGVSSTSPGTDGISVRMLRTCWDHIGHLVISS